MLPQLGWRFPAGKPGAALAQLHGPQLRPRARATIDVDFFLHGDIGRASAWALRAAVGDPVGFAGPRTHWEPDPDARLGAARRRRDRPARAAGDPRDAAGRAPRDRARRGRETRASARRSRARADVDLRWISRDGRPAGTTTRAVRRAAAAAAPARARPGVGRRRGAGDARRAPPPRRQRARRSPLAEGHGLLEAPRTPEDVDY